MSVRPDTPQSVRAVQVIEVRALRGRGDDTSDVTRVVTQYWSFDGKLLGEHDPATLGDEAPRG